MSRPRRFPASVGGGIIPIAMQIDLTDDEHSAIVEHLRGIIAATNFPHSPRMRSLRAILAKLDPVERPEPLPAPKPPGGPPSMALAKQLRARR